MQVYNCKCWDGWPECPSTSLDKPEKESLKYCLKPRNLKMSSFLSTVFAHSINKSKNNTNSLTKNHKLRIWIVDNLRTRWSFLKKWWKIRKWKVFSSRKGNKKLMLRRNSKELEHQNLYWGKARIFHSLQRIYSRNWINLKTSIHLKCQSIKNLRISLRKNYTKSRKWQLNKGKKHNNSS